MSTINKFEDLRIWQESRELVRRIYFLFSKNTNSKNDNGFNNQIQRACVSIMNNISEGFERKSDAEFAQFLNIAKGSCGEVRSMLYIANDLNYINTDEMNALRKDAISISKGIGSLMKHLRKK